MKKRLQEFFVCHHAKLSDERATIITEMII